MKTSKSTYAKVPFEASDKNLSRVTTVLEKEDSYAVETVVTNSYDVFYVVGKKDALIKTVFVGQILPMGNDINRENFNVLE
jgi:hypothetical protein